ncbi:HAAS signaling domain-containing protein [Sediminibacillus albus]|uniref:Uncharacterized protein n=1 Tax=Sediminibacillus albus TaxID=407036 RepID=A0A1G9C494_9BACI|nr:hypothetical protein [Sediminibacillus albus]SDK46500.1 hypothetical protein SAMN05216243_3238 [Sediminibacillus albus]
MNLIEVYVQEVTRWLPKKKKDDIALELESTIYDMLPDDYDEKDVHLALEELGDPKVLANKYSEKQTYLIGPKYYDLHLSILKWIIPFAAIYSLITILGVNLLNLINQGERFDVSLSNMEDVLINAITWSITAYVFVTVIFAIMEQVDGKNDDLPKWMGFTSWNPKKLEKECSVPKKKSIPLSEINAGLIWTVVWGVGYFYADRFLGIYENGQDGLRMVTPAFNQEVLLSFWPIVLLLLGAEIALAIYKLVKRKWSTNMAAFFMIYKIVSVATFIVILTQPKLFAAEFLTLISGWFDVAPSIVKGYMVWGTSTLMVVFGGISIYESFKKANMNNRSML